MDGNVRLRTQTRKSKLQAGKYEGATVASILATHPFYIKYCYYTIEKLSFTSDILEELKINPIEKPGILEGYKESVHNRKDYILWSTDRLRRLISYNKINGIEVSPDLVVAYREKKTKVNRVKGKGIESKTSLQAHNHGTYKRH